MGLFGPKRDVACAKCGKKLAKGLTEMSEDDWFRQLQRGVAALWCKECNLFSCLQCAATEHILQTQVRLTAIVRGLYDTPEQKARKVAEFHALVMDAKAYCPRCRKKGVGRSLQ